MIKFKLNHPEAKLPTRSKPGDAGFDLYAVESKDVSWPTTIKTGVHCAIPGGYVGLVRPRSGLAINNQIDVMAGVIDSGYRGELIVALSNHGDLSHVVNIGDRIAQLVVVPYMGESVEVDDLDDTDRGAGGFGHTGR